jgi:GNAT superfamily N-acetyltransferase
VSEGNSPYRIEPLADHHRRGSFSCGVSALDRYFSEQAGQDQRRDIAKVYVAVDSDGAVMGFYTLSSHTIFLADLPPETHKKLPRYPAFPAALIGRLAVDNRYQDQGIGGSLLLRALRECYELSQRIGIMAAVVDAKDDRARAFCEHFGFRRCEDHEYRLYLPITEIARLY